MLPTLKARFPTLTGGYAAELAERRPRRDCFKEVVQATQRLSAEGFEPPLWEELAAGRKPPNPEPGDVDPGEWRHGWQYFASSAREAYHLDNRVLPHCTRAEQALLRSHSGRNSARALTAVPSDKALTFSPERFAVVLRRRLRLPLLLPASHCNGCGQRLDHFGDHLAACMRSGRVQARARPVELAWKKVFEEAGATTHFQHLLANSTLPVDPADNRRIDVLVTGHGLHSRALFCDATVRSPLKGNGEPQPRASSRSGAVLKKAVKEKRRKYWDLQATPLAELVVLACEVGGRWHRTALDLVRLLAKQKAKQAHPLLRRSVELAYSDRWWSTLGCAVQNAVAGSLLAKTGKKLVLEDAPTGGPTLDELLDGQRWALDNSQ